MIVPLEEGCWLSVALWITVIGVPTIVGGGGGSGAETMLMLSLWLTFAFVESTTLIEAAKVPEAVGVPLIVARAAHGEAARQPAGRPRVRRNSSGSGQCRRVSRSHGACWQRVVVEIASGAGAGAPRPP